MASLKQEVEQMFKGSPAFGFAASIIYIACAGPTNAQDRAHDRVTSEAKAFFRAVLAANPLQPCQLYPDKWYDDPIPESIAREYLGLKICAELSYRYPKAAPKDVIDPDNKNGDAFCNQEKTQNILNKELKEFEAGSNEQFKFSSDTYTFPIFNDKFSTAILIVSHNESDWRRIANKIVRIEPFLTTYAVVYSKKHGKWKEVTTVRLSIT